MRTSKRRIIMDINRLASDSFIDVCRQNKCNVFVRNRKMPLSDLLQTMINRKGLSLTLELRNYMKITHPGESISKPGYLKQRMKLNPEAFQDLYHFHNCNFYSDPGYETFKGYLILAADGSDITIPTTNETLAMYGTASRKNTKPQAQIGLGCIYDVMNRLILESDCNKVKFDEMRVAEQQLDRLPKTIGDKPYVVIMDRGYPSTPAFIHMIEKGILFLARLKTSDYKKEQHSLTQEDNIVEIRLDKTRIRHYEGTPDGERMKELGAITLRIVKVRLENGDFEILATNIPSEAIGAKDIAVLYPMRWGIETAYETLKSRLQLENFTGTKPQLLLQDIYSTIYVSNLAEDIILDVTRELDEKEKYMKHQMAINQTVSIGILKNDLIYILLEKDGDKREMLMQQLYEDISQNLVPVRPDRHYYRTKRTFGGEVFKYS